MPIQSWVKTEPPRHSATSGDGNGDCFYQPCDACCRPLRIVVDHIGRWVTCPHCGCQLIADDLDHVTMSESTLERANRLLGLVSRLARDETWAASAGATVMFDPRAK